MQEEREHYIGHEYQEVEMGNHWDPKMLDAV